VLAKGPSTLTVGMLLESLHSTVEYEAQMAKKFSLPVGLQEMITFRGRGRS
jgi:hypothetical protein